MPAMKTHLFFVKLVFYTKDTEPLLHSMHNHCRGTCVCTETAPQTSLESDKWHIIFVPNDFLTLAAENAHAFFSSWSTIDFIFFSNAWHWIKFRLSRFSPLKLLSSSDKSANDCLTLNNSRFVVAKSVEREATWTLDASSWIVMS